MKIKEEQNMRILLTIGHPAHVHYFKNIVHMLQDRGWEFLFFVRDKECIIELVKQEGFEYISYGKGGDSMMSKMLHIPLIDLKLLRVAIKFKPDYFLSFASGYAGQVAKLLGKPHITLDDTEHAKLSHKLCYPFSDVILSPYVWESKLHKRQILFNSLVELIYLHERYFKPETNVLEMLNLSIDEKFCVVRIVSSNANHDVGLDLLSMQNKVDIIKKMAEKYKIFVSSEVPLPTEIERYRLSTPPSLFHSVIYYSSLCISEGATTASEAAVLGVPTICTAPLSLKLNNCDEEMKNGLLYRFADVDGIVNKSIEIMNLNNSKTIYKKRKDALLSNMIDVNSFLVWFIENYPNSKQIIRDNPEYQSKFK